jgi:lactate permease
MTYYLILVGSLTFIWIYGLGFNLGTVMLAVLLATLIALAVIGKRQRPRGRAEEEPERESTPSE